MFCYINGALELAGVFFPPAFARVGFAYSRHICLSFVSYDKIPMFIGPAMFDEAFMYELGDVWYFDSSLNRPKPLKWALLDFFFLFCGFGWSLEF